MDWAEWTAVEIERCFRAFSEQRPLWSRMAIGNHQAEASFGSISLQALDSIAVDVPSGLRGTAAFDERADALVVRCRGDEDAEHRLTISSIRVAPRPAQSARQWWRDAVLGRGHDRIRLIRLYF